LFAAPVASAQTVVFRDDFENGLAQWTAESLWHAESVTSACGLQVAPFPSGDGCARFGQLTQSCNYYGDPVGNLTMASSVHIPGNALTARLTYMTYEETECNGGNCGWDERFVLISDDAGQTWNPIGWGGVESTWLLKSIDLSAYIGSDVLIAFRFDAVDNWENQHLGWFVDDVTIEYGQATSYCTGKVNSAGCTPTLSYSGRPSVSETADPFTVTASSLVNRTSSKLLASHFPNFTPFHGGILCVGSPAARTTVLNSGGSPLGVVDCSGSYTFSFTPTFYAQKSFLAGETIHVQFSGRDPGFPPPGNHSFSAGMWVTLEP